MAGYSTKSLTAKLGIKDGRKVLFVGAPDGYAKLLGALPPLAARVEADPGDIPSKTLAKRAPFDFIQAFCRTEGDLSPLFPALKKLLAYDGMLWISWPKTGGRKPVPGDLNENRVRETGLETGLVDVKVCAVDETWSGLKFVFRAADRP